MSSHPNVVRGETLTWEHYQAGEGFEVRRRGLGEKAGGQQIGCSLYRQPPGKKAFPYHHHFGIEEAVYVLEGEATLRIGHEKVLIGSGDYVALPVGEKYAHQLENTGAVDFVYLCISTMTDPDIVGYPDSGKVGLMANFNAGGDAGKQPYKAFFKQASKVPYWTDELGEEDGGNA